MAKLKGAPDGKPVSSLTLLATTLHESMTVFTRAWVFGDSVLAAEISRGDWD